ncbi:30S ribosomal protein S4e [Methanofollis liminatans DSM 4140]|uniref:Small ribosomal subunit protein eS4 n=1 Tax=Methanofollis liminatans DSM 4140 TaxID=28892 RepID=J1L1B1_9EURY|nr:30S ribosomal protein S4e [Methanofollis liminatans]EJG06425.1 30S ribosomal protein S4e [Methanofollis liminatans DSM 4140]
MSYHLKRLTAPVSWHIAKKEEKFVTKTSPGPHSGAAMPVAVWLRDKMGLAGNMKEVKRILNQRQVILNGKPVTDPKLGLGIFDIISIPKIGKHYRVLTDKKGRMVTIEIDAEAAKTRLCKIRNKSIVRGGKVQLNLLYGANLLADNTYHPKDSIVVTLEGENRFAIVDHFPFAIGNMAMVIGGKHSGKVGRISEIRVAAGSIPNRVILQDKDGETFETVEQYVFMIGRETPAIAEWGIEG